MAARLLARVAILSLLASPLLAQTAPGGDPADVLLERLRVAGEEMKSMKADVSMSKSEAITGRDTTQTGTIWIERRGDGDTRGRVRFDQLISGDTLYRDRVEYVLDGDWVIDRVYRRPGDTTGGNRETHRQIRKPGTKTDLLKLGAGPFPLPIGQPVDAVHREFDVKLLPPDASKPNLKGIELAPRESNKLSDQFKTIDVWIADDQKLPTKIETTNREESEIQTTTLSNVEFNPKLSDADFALEPINPADWTITKEPYAGK